MEADDAVPVRIPDRRLRARGRMVLALAASVVLHVLLKKGLETTPLPRATAGIPAWAREPSFAPELASDFPLREEPRELPHESALEIPLAPALAAAPPPAPAPERAVPRRDVEESSTRIPVDAAAAPPVAALPGPANVAPVAERAIVRGPEPSGGSVEPIGEEPGTAGFALGTPAGRLGRPSAEPVAVAGLATADDQVWTLAGVVPPAPAAGAPPGPAEESPLARAGPSPAAGAGPRVEPLPEDAGPPVAAAGAAVATTVRPRALRPSTGRRAVVAAPRDSDDEEAFVTEPLSPPTALEIARTTAAPATPATVPPVAADSSLVRAAPVVLPSETRVRETADAFAGRTRRRPSRADGMVDRGLAWLARSQAADGRWTLGRYHPDGLGGAVRLQSDTAATGLALLAFLGAGHDHFDGPHRETVRRGLEWLVSVQKEDGDLFVPADAVSNSCAWLYSHGIATTALCEAVGLTGDPLLRGPATRALGFAVAAQQPDRGGWRYRPRADSDLSVSGWMLVALRAGRLAGLEVPQSAFDGVGGFLSASAVAGRPGRFHYNDRDPGQRPSDGSRACMTALGTLMRLHTGTPGDDPGVAAAAAELASLRPSWGTRAAPARDAYLWYYSSQVLVHSGGAAWDSWYGQLCTVLETRQAVAGPEAGSWDPLGNPPDRFGAYGGRLYVTALHLLALEVPSRRLPTYDINAARPE